MARYLYQNFVSSIVLFYTAAYAYANCLCILEDYQEFLHYLTAIVNNLWYHLSCFYFAMV